MIIKGMGELHLDVIKKRLEDEFSLPVRTGQPQVAYKEIVTKDVSLEESIDKVVGESHIRCLCGFSVRRIQENDSLSNRVIFSKAVKENTQQDALELIQSLIKQTLTCGVVGGNPLIQTEVTVERFETQDKLDDNPALSFAVVSFLKELLGKAEPKMLSPMMTLEVETPTEYGGKVISDLNMKKAKVKEIKEEGSRQIIEAEVAVEKMFNYSTHLRTLTKGGAGFSLGFSHYDVIY